MKQQTTYERISNLTREAVNARLRLINNRVYEACKRILQTYDSAPSLVSLPNIPAASINFISVFKEDDVLSAHRGFNRDLTMAPNVRNFVLRDHAEHITDKTPIELVYAINHGDKYADLIEAIEREYRDDIYEAIAAQSDALNELIALCATPP